MDDNKKELGYTADIKYEEDYSTDYTHYKQTNNNDDEQSTSSNQGDTEDDDFMQIVQDDIEDLIHLVPHLPVDLQTAINQVLKPVIRDWKKIKDEDYPRHIPDGETPIIRIPEYDPWEPKPPEWKPPEPEGPPEWEPPEQEDRDPLILIPDINDPIPGIRETKDPQTIIVSPIITDDDLFRPSTHRKIIYEPIDEIEKMKMEFVKNLAEVIHYYTTKLKKVVSEFYMVMIGALTSIRNEQDISFIVNEITSDNCSTPDQLRHLMDSALRNEVIGSNKLHFSLNTFSLESTLYHLKNFNAVQELRLRYAQIKKLEDNEIADSTSNNILNGNRNMYDKKYDLAYTNLYKYLNGSLNILEDCMRTISTGTKSKETLIRKDGLNKE